MDSEATDGRRVAGPPFFTVVVPTRTRDELLREALASVVDQSWRDFEVVVVDDEASAETRAVVESFGDARLAYVENARAAGGAGTRNTGIDRARGAWTAFLDDDDLWLPDKLRRQHELIARSDEQLGLVYTGHYKVDGGSLEVLEEITPSKRGRILRDLLYQNWIGGLSCVAVRTEALRNAGGFDERFGALQDVDLYVRIAESATVDFVAEPLVRIRRDRAPRISNDPRKRLHAAQLFWQKYASHFSGKPVLQHRAASRVFVSALAARDVAALLRSLPWTATGVVIDPNNLGYIGRGIGRSVRDVGSRGAEPSARRSS